MFVWPATDFQEVDVSSHGSFNATADITFDAVAGYAATGGSMNGSISIHRMVVACLLCGLTGVGSAQAEGGRITFSGAVVVPTCSMTAEAAAFSPVSVRPQPSYQQKCAGSGPAESSVSTCIVTERRLTHVELDRVLNYFDGYVSARQTDAVPMLVTRTYE